MFGYIATSIFRFISELLSLVGSLLFYLTPIVAIIAVIAFVQTSFALYLLAPLVSFLLGKILLALSFITEEIATAWFLWSLSR